MEKKSTKIEMELYKSHSKYVDSKEKLEKILNRELTLKEKLKLRKEIFLEKDKIPKKIKISNRKISKSFTNWLFNNNEI